MWVWIGLQNRHYKMQQLLLKKCYSSVTQRSLRETLLIKGDIIQPKSKTPAQRRGFE